MSNVITRLGRLCDKMAEVSECGKGKKCNKPCKKSKKKAKNECGKVCKKNESKEAKNEAFTPIGSHRKADFERDGLAVWDLQSGDDTVNQLAGVGKLGIAGNEEMFGKYRQRGPLYLCRWGKGENEGVVVNVTHDGKMWVTPLTNAMSDRYSDPLEMLGKYPQLAPAVKERVLVYKPMSVEQAQRTERNPR